MTSASLLSTVSALYRDARTLPVDIFQDSALERVKRHLPFDTALWGRAGMEAAGATIYSTHLHKLPDESLASYLRFKDRDVIGARAFQQPGRGILSVCLRDAAHDPEMLNDHCRRFDLGHSLTICLVDAATGMMSFLTLFRGFAASPFTDGDRADFEGLAPHLVESCHQSRLLHAALPMNAADAPNSTAACDAAFALIFVRAEFAGLMRTQWPAWLPPALPREVIDALKRCRRGQFTGPILSIRFKRQNDLYWLTAHRTTPADLLKGRQLAVARSSAAGLSHKDVARKLKMAPATVRNHLRAIYAKLKVKTRAELANAMARVEDADGLRQD